MRGFRIEPGEIETVIGREPGIKEVVVKVQKFSELDERLIAFITVENKEDVEVETIKSEIGKKLPFYMIPSLIVVMEDFPRTPNGKIDKKLLVYEKEEAPTKEVVKPQNEIEEKIHEIWKEMLGNDKISIDDNFFNIGGHSLLAIEMVAKIEKSFGIRMQLRQFFDDPRIKNLSILVEGMIFSEQKNKDDASIENSSAEIIKGEI